MKKIKKFLRFSDKYFSHNFSCLDAYFATCLDWEHVKFVLWNSTFFDLSSTSPNLIWSSSRCWTWETFSMRSISRTFFFDFSQSSIKKKNMFGVINKLEHFLQMYAIPWIPCIPVMGWGVLMLRTMPNL